MPDRMLEHMSDRMLEIMSEYMSDITRSKAFFLEWLATIIK
jgi:hypothetical protein